jgi:hypothetical protein
MMKDLDQKSRDAITKMLKRIMRETGKTKGDVLAVIHNMRASLEKTSSEPEPVSKTIYVEPDFEPEKGDFSRAVYTQRIKGWQLLCVVAPNSRMRRWPLWVTQKQIDSWRKSCVTHYVEFKTLVAVIAEPHVPARKRRSLSSVGLCGRLTYEQGTLGR